MTAWIRDLIAKEKVWAVVLLAITVLALAERQGWLHLIGG
jgi:hypothetical protein